MSDLCLLSHIPLPLIAPLHSFRFYPSNSQVFDRAGSHGAYLRDSKTGKDYLDMVLSIVALISRLFSSLLSSPLSNDSYSKQKDDVVPYFGRRHLQ